MKGWVKCIIAGAVILVIGVAIVIGTLAFNGWKLKKPEFEMKTYTATDSNTAIDVEIGAGSVTTEFYDGDKITVEYPSSSVLKSVIHERNGVFRFESEIKRFMFWGSIDVPNTVIKLPKDCVFDLDIEVNAGSVNIASGKYGKAEIEVNAGKLTVNQSECSFFLCDVDAGLLEVNGLNCNKFDCEVNAGKLNVSDLVCPDIRADVNAGELIIGVDGVKAEYTIISKARAGKCNVSNQTGTTDKKLDVECSAGSININFAG